MDYDAVEESGRGPVSKNQIDDSARVWRMSGLTGDGTADHVSRPNSQARTETGENIIFPVQLTTSRIGILTRLIHTLAMVECDDHTNILMVQDRNFSSLEILAIEIPGILSVYCIYCSSTSTVLPSYLGIQHPTYTYTFAGTFSMPTSYR